MLLIIYLLIQCFYRSTHQTTHLLQPSLPKNSVLVSSDDISGPIASSLTVSSQFSVSILSSSPSHNKVKTCPVHFNLLLSLYCLNLFFKKNIARAQTINILVIEFNEKFGLLRKDITIKSRQSFYALRILRSYGLLSDYLFGALCSTTVCRVLGCSSMWCCFKNAQKQ